MYMNSITLIGLAAIFFYSITQIFSFYGIGEDVYGAYLLFYFFMIVSVLVLPNSYPQT